MPPNLTACTPVRIKSSLKRSLSRFDVLSNAATGTTKPNPTKIDLKIKLSIEVCSGTVLRTGKLPPACGLQETVLLSQYLR